MKHYKPTLKYLHGKGKWYVGMTVPKEVRHILGGQIRLSTGTSDKNEAQKRLPELAIQLYQKIIDAKDRLEADVLKGEVLEIAHNLNRENEINVENLNKDALIALLHNLTTSQNNDIVPVGTFDVSNLIPKGKPHKSPFKRIDSKVRQHEVGRAKRLLMQLEGAQNSFKQLADEWLEKNNWNREKGRKSFQSHINRFISIMGDVEVTTITPVMLYDFADVMATEYQASHSTITNYIGSISSVLKYSIRQGVIETNPASSLDLKPYGASEKKRKPFTHEMLVKLFSQDLPDDIRLLWSILISTGMRLDEAALLKATDIKTQQDIRFFDLTEAVVKNEGSARKVPVPSVIEPMLEKWLADLTSERLFTFPVNADGKAQNAASKKSMYYIRKVMNDEGLVTHSFRHSFKDLCRNADIPQDLHDFITGHSGGDSASNYGEGHSLIRRKEALERLNLNSIIVG